METTLYEEYQSHIIRTYYQNIKDGIYLKENTDLNTKEQQEIYYKFINQVIKNNPKEYYQKDFNKFLDTYKLISDIIILLLDNCKNTIDEINEFFNKIYISDNEEILSGAYLEIYDTDKKKKQSLVEIPSDDNLSSVVSIIHEFIHFHISKFKINLEQKFYYGEILSIFLEKVATNIIMKMSLQKDFEQKVEQTRLEGIKWHYIDAKENDKKLKALYKTLSFIQNFNPNAKDNIKTIEKYAPWVNNKEEEQIYNLYNKALRESYGIGYIYGECLNYYYLNSQSSTLNKVSKVLKGTTNIRDLLNYYNINLNNDKNVDIAINKVKKICK